MEKFAFYFHGGSGNRGCEALVTATSAMLKKYCGDCFVRLYSMAKDEDDKSGYRDVSSILNMMLEEKSEELIGFFDKIIIKLLSKKSSHRADEYFYSRLFSSLPLKEDSVFLSIGGDNYCYGENNTFYAFHKVLKKLNKKTVLWGCSLDESSFSHYNEKDLHNYDWIFARESETYELLKSKGFSNIYLYPDPAFTLETEFLPLPEGFVEGKTVGINASPLVFKYESEQSKGLGMKSYEKLIEYILNETDNSVLLIPHVFWKSNDDREPLSKLYEKYKESGRVIFLDKEYSAKQLKGFIARCRAFIGARTHSTIAAYSSGVPTLVLGYSVKSVNIAKDLFGKTDGFVVPIDKLRDENGLADAFAELIKNEEIHRKALSDLMPSYIEKSFSAAEKLHELVK